ncbi:lipase family protein [Nocardia miyunensis]|uniref:lipase family protein n=1 Tax=Nocardia miyunensis TaxID=282684 RepID=UPI000832DC63|nr:lipase family protein [Nocardia miyunensis]
MRTWRVLLIVIALVCGSATGFADAGPIPAGPPNPPALPAIPALPGIDIGAVQRWIDAVVPAPPIVSPADPIAASPGASADLARLQQAVMPSAVGDPIFDQWPPDLAAEVPGAIIAVRDVTATAAPVLVVPVRQVLLLKFRTTDAYGGASFATATLVIPAANWVSPGERPVVVNNLAIDALGRACTPGYTLAHGFNAHTNLGDDLPPTTQLAVLRGYAVLIPDHEGPRMAYAEPYVAGHAVLDSIRAVRNLRPEEFGASRFAMHGYSGGAIATRGAVALIGSYAPELTTVIVGAALGGVPVDYRMLASSMNANLASGIFLAATFGVARERPEILGMMNNLARWAAISPLKDTCDSVFAPIGVLMLPADLAAKVPDALHSPLADRIYAVTVMSGMRSPVPLYVYQGAQEFWIPARGARDYYAQQCALGARAVYRNVLGEHLIADALGYPEAAAWVDQRLQGIPAPDEC